MNTPRNARFWTLNPGNPDALVKLTLRPGQSLMHCRYDATEEGWTRCTESWTYHKDIPGVFREWCDEGRDCDGRSTTGGSDHANIDQLARVPHCPHCFCRLEPDVADYCPGYPIAVCEACGSAFNPSDMRAPRWKDQQSDPIYDEHAQAGNY